MSIQAQRIRERRKQLNMSQEDLAAAINTSQGQVSRYEKGDNDPTSEVLLQIARALNTSTDWLLGLTQYPEPQVLGQADLNDTERQIIQTLRSKTLEQQQRIVEIIRLVN